MKLFGFATCLLHLAIAQPQGNPGYATATGCPSVTTCSESTNNYAVRSLTYDVASGKFSGTITGNQCPGKITTFNKASPTCFTQTFPQYSSFPQAAPMTGAVGYTLDGLNIYNPLEAGFSSSSGPTVCSTSGYYCAAGGDLTTCKNELIYTCGANAPTWSTIFGDDCHGHASPYHFHEDLKCSYSPSAVAAASTVTAHSALVGIALDGRGIYGAWEAAGAAATRDACGGHTGPTPATASMSASGTATTGITGFAGSTSVYHYHLSTSFPYTLGCYGSANVSYTACTALYTSCKNYIPMYAANGSMFFYDDWCPCGAGGNSGPTIPIGTLPPSGSNCFSSTKGNSQATNAGTVECTLSLLSSSAATGGSGGGPSISATLQTMGFCSQQNSLPNVTALAALVAVMGNQTNSSADLAALETMILAQTGNMSMFGNQSASFGSMFGNQTSMFGNQTGDMAMFGNLSASFESMFGSMFGNQTGGMAMFGNQTGNMSMFGFFEGLGNQTNITNNFTMMMSILAMLATMGNQTNAGMMGMMGGDGMMGMMGAPSNQSGMFGGPGSNTLMALISKLCGQNGTTNGSSAGGSGPTPPKPFQPTQMGDAMANYNKCKVTGGANCTALLGNVSNPNAIPQVPPKDMVASVLEGCNLPKQQCQDLAKQAMKNLTGKDMSNQDAAVALAEAARANLAATLQTCITAANTSDAKRACRSNSTARDAYAASLGRNASSITDVDMAKAARDGAKNDVSDYISSCVAAGNAVADCMKPNSDLKKTIADATGVDTSSLKDSSVQRILDRASRDQALQAAQACNDTAAKCREAARSALKTADGGNVSDAVLSQNLRQALLGDVADSMQACIADAGSNTSAYKLCFATITADIQAATFRNTTPSVGEIKRILKDAGVKKVQETAELCNLTRDECRAIQRQALAQSLGQSVSDISTADVELSNKAAAFSSGADTVKACAQAKQTDTTSTCDDPYQAVLAVRQASMPSDNLTLGIDKAQVYQAIVVAQQKDIQTTCYDLTTKADADACLADFSSQLSSTAALLFASADSSTQAMKLAQAQLASAIDVVGDSYDTCMSVATTDADKTACMAEFEAKQDVAGITSTGVVVSSTRRLQTATSRSKDTLTKHSMSLVANAADSCNTTDRPGCMKSMRDNLANLGYPRKEFASNTRLGLTQAAAQTWAACAEVQNVSKTLPLASVDGTTAPSCDTSAAQKLLDLAGQSTNITDDIAQKIRKLGFGILTGKLVQLRYRNEVVVDVVTDGLNCSDRVMNATIHLISAKVNATGKNFTAVLPQGCAVVFGTARYTIVVRTPSANSTDISDLSTSMTTALNNSAIAAASRRLQESATVTDTYAAQGSDTCAEGDTTCGGASTTTTTMAYFVTNVTTTTTTKLGVGSVSYSQREVLMVLPSLALVLMPSVI